jgi:hypothetical protein
MNKKQALSMLAFISDLYAIIQETNAKEAAEAAAQVTANGKVPAESSWQAEPVTTD